jgi:molecular chaperone Hsp33
MDYLTRGTNQTKHIQAFACLTTDMVEEARERHDLWPVASAALGRTMSVTAMMASEL